MNNTKFKKLILLIASLACFWGAGSILPNIIKLRDESKLSVNPVTKGIPPKVVLATTALGGFRGLFIDILWLRAMALKEEGNFYEMIQVYDWITNLQPNYSMVWRYIAWDLAYNVSVEINNLQDRWFWVYRGIQYLRDKGIPYNKYDPELYAELSWIFYHKIGSDLDFAHRYYRSELARMMDADLKGGCDRKQLEIIVSLPEKLEEVIKLPALAEAKAELDSLGVNLLDAYNDSVTPSGIISPEIRSSYEKESIQKAFSYISNFYVRKTLIEKYKLKPERMLALNKKYGPIDWRTCDAYSLYYSTLGRDMAKRIDPDKAINLNHERRVYFTLAKMVSRGRTIITEDNTVYNVPDYRFLESARKVMKNLIDRGESSLTEKGRKPKMTGVYSGYSNFLKNAVFLYYFNGQIKYADRFLGYLREVNPGNKIYELPPKVFVNTQIKEWIDAISMDKFAGLLDGNIRQYYFFLSIGDFDNAKEKLQWAKMIHELGKKRWPYIPGGEDQWEGVVPVFSEVLDDFLIRILDGKEPMFNSTMRTRLEKILSPERIKKARRHIERKKQAKEIQRNKASKKQSQE